jgi:hypothetical protein
MAAGQPTEKGKRPALTAAICCPLPLRSCKHRLANRERRRRSAPLAARLCSGTGSPFAGLPRRLIGDRKWRVSARAALRIDQDSVPARAISWGFFSAAAASAFSLVVPGFDDLDGVFQTPFRNAPADGPEHEAEPPPLDVLAVAYDDHVNVGRAIGLTREGVGVARRTSPRLGVGPCETNGKRMDSKRK